MGLGTVYRVAPSRDRPTWDFLRVGTIAASLLWLAGSAAFSFYASHFGSYDRTYGSLGGVMLLSFWFWIVSIVLLIAVQINKILEDEKEASVP